MEIFIHHKLCLADAIFNFKWLKIIQIWQRYWIIDLLIDVTIYLKQKLVFNVLV